MLCFALGGCESTTEVAEVTPTAVPTAESTSSSVTYRVGGAARGVTGNYTDVSGIEVPIPATVAATAQDPAYTPVPWEITVQIPHDVMRKNQIAVGAQDAFGTGANVTVEILVDGKSITTGSGEDPRIYIMKH